MATPRRVQDLIVHDAKERPSSRAAIERQGLRPQILCDSSARYWDGFTVFRSDGQGSTAGTNLKTQIRRMAAWGEFGDAVADAFIDIDRYQYIQEHLLNSPDQSVTQKEGLHRLDWSRTTRARGGATKRPELTNLNGPNRGPGV